MGKPYSNDPTSNGDIQAEIMRIWYEEHRESWRDRYGRFGSVICTGLADNFMLEMLQYANRVQNCEIGLPASMRNDDE